MKDKFYEDIKIPVILLILVIFMFSGCKNTLSFKEQEYYTDTINKATLQTQKSEEYAVEPPPFSDGIYPCNDCHANFAPNPVRRNLTWHEDITAMFNHDSENRWCLDCHDLKDRNYLRLASGQLLDFKESYKLCGQCHGEKYRDWKVGVHGKRTGYWNGKKEYLLCVSCHNPHSPKFKELTPDPPPVRQEDIK
jgi:hypothetical protein